jgi:ribosomal protein S18 acetylase RimI-like enzyme
MKQAPRAVLRTAALEDASELARIHVASWRESYRGIVPDSMLDDLSVGRRAEAWRGILRDPTTASDTVVFLVEEDRKAVAFAACGIQRTEQLKANGYDGEISAIYVLKRSQHTGIGRRLMAAAAANLASRGYRGVALWVLAENLTARRFYEACGGRVVATQEDVRQTTTLSEVAYGWTALASLISESQAADPSYSTLRVAADRSPRREK